MQSDSTDIKLADFTDIKLTDDLPIMGFDNKADASNKVKHDIPEVKPPTQFGSIEQYTDLVLKYAEIIVREADTKLNEYPTGDNNVLSLLLLTAHAEGVSPWDVYRVWMNRHLLPFLFLCESHGDEKLIEKRLRDLLGYIFLALELNELPQQKEYENAWEKLRSLGVDKTSNT